ncbi:MAG: type II toxin-antitoxin system PemK/MazF family toxin [Coriobacteriia bacterium]
MWWAALDPAKGSEIRKTRPVVVVSSDAMGLLPIKIVVPCTGSDLAPKPWRVPVSVADCPGLDRDTTADVLQTRSLDAQRFENRIGSLNEETMSDIVSAIALVVEYE